jgi:PKD repeat protein/pimeloyl-ACP methyl ester carboxylesterase
MKGFARFRFLLCVVCLLLIAQVISAEQVFVSGTAESGVKYTAQQSGTYKVTYVSGAVRGPQCTGSEDCTCCAAGRSCWSGYIYIYVNRAISRGYINSCPVVPTAPDYILGTEHFSTLADAEAALAGTYVEIPLQKGDTLTLTVRDYYHLYGDNIGGMTADVSRNLQIILDKDKSGSWVDPLSGDSKENTVKLYYTVAPSNARGSIGLEIWDSVDKKNALDGVTNLVGTASAEGSVSWDGKNKGVKLNEAHNPYYVSLVLVQNGKEVARTDRQKVWVGKPVLVVHGILTTADAISGDKLFTTLKKDHAAYAVEYARSSDRESSYDLFSNTAFDDIKTFAARLNNKINEIEKDTGAKKVDIVSHSMGGLISRWTIQQMGRRDVDRLIMIGTPNHGSEWASAARIPGGGRIITLLKSYFNPNAALYEMMPHSPFLNQLNGNDNCANQVENSVVTDTTSSGYYTIAGLVRIGDLPALTTPSHIHSWLIPQLMSPSFTSGDLIVPYYSVKLSGVPFESVPYSHTSQTNAVPVTTRVLYLLRMTDSQYASYGTSHTTSSEYDNLEETDASEYFLVQVPPVNGNLTSLSTKNYYFNITAGSPSAQMYCLWADGDLNVSVISPSAVIRDIPPEDSSAVYAWNNPEPGKWTVRIRPRSISANGTPLSIQSYYESPLGLSMNTGDPQYSPGSTIPISVYLGTNTTGFPGAAVKAVITNPDGATKSLTLYDDGLHGDNATHDGIYANAFTNTSTRGIYSLVVTAKGTSLGEPFLRQTDTIVWVDKYPDLELDSSDIRFSNTTPVAGEKVHIYATVHNTGDDDAKNASIQVYDGDPSDGRLISKTVMNISRAASRTLNFAWVTRTGTHNITVIVSPFNGFLEKDYTNNRGMKQLVVRGPPVAGFTATPTSGYIPITVSFTDTSTNNPTSWAWDFGDGNNATIRNPVHIYSSPGNYTVYLNATNGAGSDTKSKLWYIVGIKAPVSQIGVFRPPAHAFFLKNGTKNTTVTWGLSTDTPVAGDWNGDGLADVGIFRPSVHRFFLKNGSANTSVTWGLNGDKAVSGDWNGDGLWDVGVFRNASHLFLLKNGTRNTSFRWGLSTDLPVSGDWNGDGLWEVGVFRPLTHTFYLRNGTRNTSVSWGLSADLPVSGDWNGDGLWEVGVFRNSTHVFIVKNGTRNMTYTWGLGGDKPVTGKWS